MAQKLPDPLPEVVFSSSDPAISRAIAAATKSRKLKKLAPRIYTSATTDDPERIIRRNLYRILGHSYPGAIVSHRSALEGKPTPDWTLFLTYRYKKTISLPGVTVKLIAGPAATDDDSPFLDGLFLSSLPRALLENMQPSRSRGSVSKTLSRKEIEERVDKIIRLQGEDKLNALRDEARRRAPELGMEKEFTALDALIGALLTTKPGTGLSSGVAKARAEGKPFDPERIELFQSLFAALKSTELPLRVENEHSETSWRNLSFFDAYFSNYIEGTIFELHEAREIVWEGAVPAARPEDAHDILGTYRVVSDAREMSLVPESEASFVGLLRARHEIIMGARPNARPGTFKEKPNRAGQTHFVAPELVSGSLAKGYAFYRALDNPLARAMMMMFVVAEVHPFVDGNGRIARIMMNAELIAAGIRRILIPTVYRDDYLLALRALSRNAITEPYVTMLDRAQRFSAKLDFSSYEEAHQALEQANAFLEPSEARFLDDL